MRTTPMRIAAVAGLFACRANTTPREPDAVIRSAVPRRLLDAPDAYLTHGAATLRYGVIGEGEPVILLHGFADRLERWDVVADSLARDFRVIAIDLRGGFPALMLDSARVTTAAVPALSFAARPDPFIRGARWVATHWPDTAYVEIAGRNHSDLCNAPELRRAFRSLVARAAPPL
jgi:pimeloyl-ACP methyl ester carboxylesterase